MKVLFTVLLVLLASCVHFSSQACSPTLNVARTNSTINLYDCCETNATFVVSKGPPNTVDWTLEGDRYKVLGSEECLPGQGWVYDGNISNWVCNPDLSFTGDQLSQLIFMCQGTNNLPVYTGTNWICSQDFDTLRSLNCTAGQTVKYMNATRTFVCANDNDTLGQLIQQCPPTFIPVFRDGRFGCFSSSGSVGTDTLSSLIPNCTNLYIPKYINGTWMCAIDNDFLRSFTCPAGQLLKRTVNGTWGCGTDMDTFLGVTANCSAVGQPSFDTPVLTANGWTCVEAPTLNVSRELGTVLYSNFYRFDPDGSLREAFVGFYPIRLPYRGIIKAFGLRAIPVDGNQPTINAYITVNDNPISESTISRVFPVDPDSSSVFGLSTAVFAQDVIDVFIESLNSITYINVEIYIELNTSA